MPENTYYDPDEMADETDPLHTTLLADGAQWRAHAADTSTLERHLELLRQQMKPPIISMAPNSLPLGQTLSPRANASADRWSAMLVVGVILIVFITAVVFVRSRQDPGYVPTTTSSAVTTSIGSPTPTATPVIVTAAGITISFDGMDTNPIRTAVHYHIVTQPLKARESYGVQISTLSDRQQHVYASIGGDGISDSGISPFEFYELDFVPIAPTQTGAVTFTFQITTINDSIGTDSTIIPGLWTYTATVIPERSGVQTFTSAGVTANGITIKPTAADWISGGDHFSHTGLHIQLAMSGLSTQLTGSTFFVPTKYVDAIGGNGSQIDYLPVVTLTAPHHQILIIPAVFRDTLNADNTIGSSGKAFIDVVFQNVVVTHGEDIQLLIENLGTCTDGDCSAGAQPLPGTWSLTLHL